MIPPLDQLPWLIGAILSAVAVAGSLRPNPGVGPLRGSRWLSSLLVAGFGLIIVVVVIDGAASPRDWDFKCFWSWGAAMHAGDNPYDQTALLRAIEPHGLAEESVPEFHCLYPPPSLLLFAPLGWMPFRVALVVWSILQAAVLVVCLWRLARDFFPEGQRPLALAACAMVIAWRPTTATFFYAQTNFLTLLVLLGFWRDRNRPRAGVWLALGALVKPWLAGLGLYLLVRGRWRGIAAAVITGVGIASLAWLLLGGDLYRGYLTREDVSQHYPLAQPLNQSLSGVLLRGIDPQGAIRTLGQAPWLVGMLTAVVGAAAIAMKQAGPDRDEAALAILPPTLLLAYPASLSHYGVALAPSVAWLLSQTAAGRFRRDAMLALVAAASLAMAMGATFVASLGVLIACTLAALRPERPADGAK